tara:strand:- start:1739 stop:1912 length:174 start_codon:yes stop_codon:yes gene_type:complete
MNEINIDESIRQQASNYKAEPENISSSKLVVINRNPTSESNLVDNINYSHATGGKYE